MEGLKDSRSQIPLRMKRQCKWVMGAEVIWKGKKYTIIITNPSNKEKEDEIIYLTLNHITIEEDDNDELIIKEDVEKALPSFKSENKPTMNELKEINLGTVENLRITFINANISPEEKMNYMELLIEYRDIFAYPMMKCQV